MISDGLEKESYGEVIVHETAHQWWQTTVGNNEIEYGFLDEGLAEYSVVLFYENYPEYNLKRETLIKSAEQTYRTYCSVYDKLFGETNTKMLRSLKDFTSEYEYVNLAYVKSAIMYDTLRTTVGDQTFFNSLKKYYSDFSFKNATPYDLCSAFENCGVDVNGYFQSFFDGEVII
jgi:aminopeptidase N